MADDKKPRRGRPRKPDTERRSHAVRTHLNDKERAMVIEAAGLYDMSVSEYVRSCAMATAHAVAPDLESIERAVVGLASSQKPAEA